MTGWVCPAAFASMLVVGVSVSGASAEEPSSPFVSNIVEVAERNPAAACLQPPAVVRLEDYDGPFRNTVATFARKGDAKPLHEPRYKPKTILCTRETSDKLRLFVADTIDPLSLAGVGFDAALDHVQRLDPMFGAGPGGFSRRFLADFGAQTSSRFFSEFAYPTVFSEDPRYYRLASGPIGKRVVHALGHMVVAHRDNGQYMFNYSEILGTATGTALSYAYHPGSRTGVRSAAQGAVFSLLSDSGFDLLREFWPEVARTLRMPFRGVTESAANR